MKLLTNNYIVSNFNITNPAITKLLNYDKNERFLFEEIEEYFDIYVNNEKIDYCSEYNFKKNGKISNYN